MFDEDIEMVNKRQNIQGCFIVLPFGRCEIPSPDCPPSAFTKYSPNSRDTLTRSQTHRQDNQPANSQSVLALAAASWGGYVYIYIYIYTILYPQGTAVLSVEV